MNHDGMQYRRYKVGGTSAKAIINGYAEELESAGCSILDEGGSGAGWVAERLIERARRAPWSTSVGTSGASDGRRMNAGTWWSTHLSPLRNDLVIRLDAGAGWLAEVLSKAVFLMPTPAARDLLRAHDAGALVVSLGGAVAQI